MPMEIINNNDKTLKDDLLATIREGSRLSIAASCFSIYAFQMRTAAQPRRQRELYSEIKRLKKKTPQQ